MRTVCVWSLSVSGQVERHQFQQQTVLEEHIEQIEELRPVWLEAKRENAAFEAASAVH